MQKNSRNGVSLWAAEMICEDKQRIPIYLHIIAAHGEQAANWGEDLRARYDSILEKADARNIIV